MRKDGLLIKSSEISKLNSVGILYLLGVKAEKNDTNQPINTETNILVAKINGLIQIVTSTNIFANVDNFDKVETRTTDIFEIDNNAEIINYSISSVVNFYYLKYWNAQNVLRSFWGEDQVNPSEYGDFVSEYEKGLIYNQKVVDDLVCYYDEISKEYLSHDSFCDERVSKSILEYFDFEIMGATSLQYEYFILKRNEIPIDVKEVDTEREVLIGNNDTLIFIGKIEDEIWNKNDRFNKLLVNKEKYVFEFNKIIYPFILKWGFEYDSEDNSYYRIRNSFKQSLSFFQSVSDKNKANLIETDIVANISPIGYSDWYRKHIDNKTELTEKEIDRMARSDYSPVAFYVPLNFEDNKFFKSENISYEDYMKILFKIFIDIIYFFKQREHLGSFLGHSNYKIVTSDLLLMNNLKDQAKKELQQYANAINTYSNMYSKEERYRLIDEINLRIELFFPGTPKIIVSDN